MTRIEKLQSKLRARQGVPGFEKNCELIRQEIARLTTSLSEPEAVASAASKG